MKNQKKSLKKNKILVFGGWGYQNTGDEAQCNESIRRVNRCFPGWDIKLMTPDIEYTKEVHKYNNVAEAPRIVFFNAHKKVGGKIYWGVKHWDQNVGLRKNCFSMIKNMLFLIKSSWIYMNAKMININMPTFLISKKAKLLLNDIWESKMIYFGGWGGMTGSTMSRFWEANLICRIAELYDIPVVMSGQTMGVWGSKFNKKYAAKGLRKVKLITVRDIGYSLNDLAEIGLKGDHIYHLCDDALFCEKEEQIEILKDYYAKSGCGEEYLKEGYIAFHMHDWSTYPRKWILERINKIVDETMRQTGKSILLIPMAPGDESAMKEYMEKYPNNKIKILKYDYKYQIIRSIISKADLCITMKHHPIIFSVGEMTPVIALNLSEYYHHKNNGALQILNMEEYSVTLEADSYLDEFSYELTQVLLNRDEIYIIMKKTLEEIKKKVGDFESKIQKLICY